MADFPTYPLGGLTNQYFDHCDRAKSQGFRPLTFRQFVTLIRSF